jgi:heme-degrading monooxygenase HmoA
MIGRVWRGWTSEANADPYQRLLEEEVVPDIRARVEGFRGVFVLRRDAAQGVEFVVLTLWGSMEAVKALVGDDPERAHVPESARKLLDWYDERVVHHEVVLQAVADRAQFVEIPPVYLGGRGHARGDAAAEDARADRGEQDRSAG